MISKGKKKYVLIVYCVHTLCTLVMSAAMSVASQQRSLVLSSQLSEFQIRFIQSFLSTAHEALSGEDFQQTYDWPHLSKVLRYLRTNKK